MAITFQQFLTLRKCPHCSRANPSCEKVYGFNSKSGAGGTNYNWAVYTCGPCGLPIVVGGPDHLTTSKWQFPNEGDPVPEVLPAKVRSYLQQASESLHSPSGANMLCASAIDAMLKDRDLKKGSLYSRIDAAAESGLITEEMAAWAHDVST